VGGPAPILVINPSSGVGGGRRARGWFGREMDIEANLWSLVSRTATAIVSAAAALRRGGGLGGRKR
jgi:hypothetical protein